jgi:hypothetical protein
MKRKINGYVGPTGYLSLEDCILSWGEEGRKLFNTFIRQRISNKDIHKLPDGYSLRSMESQPFFLTITRK